MTLPSPFAAGRFFKLNRNTPEAQANQLKWAREQMEMEVPETTADGEAIASREDMIVKYMESERAKFGREIDRVTAEGEVDEWLLKQATYAPSKTRCVPQPGFDSPAPTALRGRRQKGQRLLTSRCHQPRATQRPSAATRAAARLAHRATY